MKYETGSANGFLALPCTYFAAVYTRHILIEVLFDGYEDRT